MIRVADDYLVRATADRPLRLTRRNPGPVNRLASKQSLAWLERRVITTVPWPHRGAGRRVYPGFLQIAGFMGLDPWRHISAIATLVGDVARGKDEEAGRTKSFYEEYFAVIDVTAEFYLETARSVFIDFDLARGRMRWRDRPVKSSAIRGALLTIEAENDRLCPQGRHWLRTSCAPGSPRAESTSTYSRA